MEEEEGVTPGGPSRCHTCPQCQAGLGGCPSEALGGTGSTSVRSGRVGQSPNSTLNKCPVHKGDTSPGGTRSSQKLELSNSCPSTRTPKPPGDSGAHPCHQNAVPRQSHQGRQRRARCPHPLLVTKRGQQGH